MIVLSELSTAEEYAKMCGVTINTIYYRHRKRSIASIEIDGHVFVDSRLSPPQKYVSFTVKKHCGRILLPPGVDLKDYVSIYSYTYKKIVRPDVYYGMAATGKIQAIAAGYSVFMLKADADKIPIKRFRKSRYFH